MKPQDSVSRIDFKGLPALQLNTASGARAVVSLFGAQVLSWIPAGGQERLYLSESALFDGRSAIRGGIPVCWPQFAAQGRLPRHGLVRTLPWQVLDERAGAGYALVTLRITDDEATWAQWPHGFALELTVLLEGQRLGYAGRPASASPAVGYSHLHQEQQKALLDQAFGKLKGFVLSK